MTQNPDKPQHKEQTTNSDSPGNNPQSPSEQPPFQHYCQKLEEIIN